MKDKRALRDSYLYRPILITGYNKSGTTLLLSLLDNHEQLTVIPEELHFFSRVLFKKDKMKTIMNATGFRLFLSDDIPKMWSKGKSWFREGYPEIDKRKLESLIEEAVQEHRSSKDLLLRLVKAFALASNSGEKNKRGWVSKTTQEEIYFPIIRRMFGDNARVIYVVRDPRDVYTSFSKRRMVIDNSTERNLIDLLRFIVSWRTQVNYALRLERKYNNFHIFRYEDLVSRPIETITKLSDFLEIGFSDSLLRPTRLGKPWNGNSMFSEAFTGLSKEPVGRYRSSLTLQERVVIERFLAKEIISLGYGLSKEETIKNSIKLANAQLLYLTLLLSYHVRYRAKEYRARIRAWLEEHLTQGFVEWL